MKKDCLTPASLLDISALANEVRTAAENLGLKETPKALDFAQRAHEGQKRKNSDVPYICHPLTLACHALKLGVCEDDVVAACLLHDVVEDCGVRAEDLPVSDEARRLVLLLTCAENTPETRGAVLEEYYRGIASDPKASFIKCLDRCNNLTSMCWGLSPERRLRKAKETREYYPALFETLFSTPAYSKAAWLLRYQIEGLLEIYDPA